MVLSSAQGARPVRNSPGIRRVPGSQDATSQTAKPAAGSAEAPALHEYPYQLDAPMSSDSPVQTFVVAAFGDASKKDLKKKRRMREHLIVCHAFAAPEVADCCCCLEWPRKHDTPVCHFQDCSFLCALWRSIVVLQSRQALAGVLHERAVPK
jgi:hypothetical protein